MYFLGLVERNLFDFIVIGCLTFLFLILRSFTTALQPTTRLF